MDESETHHTGTVSQAQKRHPLVRSPMADVAWPGEGKTREERSEAAAAPRPDSYAGKEGEGGGAVRSPRLHAAPPAGGGVEHWG